MEQLWLWEIYQDHWCEHKLSMTCYYRDDEFMQVGWPYNKFDKVRASFLLTQNTQKQAPYSLWILRLTRRLLRSFQRRSREHRGGSDMTEGAQQLACVSGVCECRPKGAFWPLLFFFLLLNSTDVRPPAVSIPPTFFRCSAICLVYSL